MPRPSGRRPGRSVHGPHLPGTGSRLSPKPFHRVTAPGIRLTGPTPPTRVPRKRPVVAGPESGPAATAASGKWLTGIAMSVAGATVVVESTRSTHRAILVRPSRVLSVRLQQDSRGCTGSWQVRKQASWRRVPAPLPCCGSAVRRWPSRCCRPPWRWCSSSAGRPAISVRAPAGGSPAGSPAASRCSACSWPRWSPSSSRGPDPRSARPCRSPRSRPPISTASSATSPTASRSPRPPP